MAWDKGNFLTSIHCAREMEESKEDFEKWLKQAFDKSISLDQVDPDALEHQLRSMSTPEWGAEISLDFSSHPDDARQDDDWMDWFQQYIHHHTHYSRRPLICRNIVMPAALSNSSLSESEIASHLIGILQNDSNGTCLLQTN